MTIQQPRHRRSRSLLTALVVGLALAAWGLPATADVHEPTLSIDDVSGPEGHDGDTSFTFTVTLEGPTLDPVTVGWETQDVEGSAVGIEREDEDDTADVDGDYVSASGEFTFGGPEVQDQTHEIEITVLGDTEVEEVEEFLVVLTVEEGEVQEGEMQGTGTIENDDPSVSAADTAVAEGETATVQVALTSPAEETTVVSYRTEDDGTDDAAGAGEDYVEVGDGEVTFLAGEDTATIEIGTMPDDEPEEDETFTVVVECDEEVCFGSDAATVTIVDDEPRVSIADAQVGEGDEGDTPTMGFTVSLSGPSDRPISLQYVTSDGGDDPATGGDGSDSEHDYVAVPEQDPGTVTIPAGETEATVPVTVLGDDRHEPAETFTVTLSPTEDEPHYELAEDEAVGAVVDDDGPTISITGTRKVEGHQGHTFMDFPVELSHAPDIAVEVDYTTIDGTATGSEADDDCTTEDADFDYESRDATLSFDPGEVRKLLRIEVCGDLEPEPNETLRVRLTDPVNAGFPQGADRIGARGTILNDDGPRLTVGDIEVDEGDSATTDARFTVTLHDGEADATVDWRTVNGIAKAGQDYTAGSGRLTVPAGAGKATITVEVRGNEVEQPDRTFFVDLTGAEGATILDRRGQATIVDDDGGDGDGGSGGGGTDGGGSTGGDGGGTGVDDGGGAGTVDGDPVGEVIRSGGADRIETALQVSRDHWDQAPDVVLATASTYPDALAGGTLSALLDAPLLLTFPDRLADGVAAELDRLGTGTVWILGGPVAVSLDVQAELAEDGFEVLRFFGGDRFETAAEIARGTGPSHDGEVVLALGAHPEENRAWPDALSAGTLAAVPDPLPVLLTRSGDLPEATTSALVDMEVSTVYVLGGHVAVSEDVEAELTALGHEVVRLAGATRYGTSVAAAIEALSRHGDLGARDVVLATGQNFPDGLAAGALAGRLDGLLLLVPRSDLEDETEEFITSQAARIDRGVIVGGPHAVSPDVGDRAAAALGGGG